MNLTTGLLPAGWIWTGHFLYLAVLAAALLGAPWKAMRVSEMQNVFLGACTALLVLWSLVAGVHPGLGFHQLGATVLTLMFGWEFAVLGLSIVLLGTTLNGMAGWDVFSVNALLFCVLPVVVSHGVFRLVDRRLPNNIFIYLFLAAFFGAGLAMAASAAAAAAVLVASGVYAFDMVAHEYLPYLPLMAFPEALLNGMVMTILVGFFPRWVWTFDDSRYLRPL